VRLPPRPRDALGRPLARDSGVPVEPDPEPLPPADTVDEAQRLLDAGRAFRAHEVLEATWKAAPEPDRELWRGLAQLAVGVTHAQRGNRTGSATLLRRGAATLAPWQGRRPYDVDVAGLRAWADAAAGQVEQGQPLPEPPRLRSGG
jgi:hypothetical protein